MVSAASGRAVTRAPAAPLTPPPADPPEGTATGGPSGLKSRWGEPDFLQKIATLHFGSGDAGTCPIFNAAGVNPALRHATAVTPMHPNPHDKQVFYNPLTIA